MNDDLTYAGALLVSGLASGFAGGLFGIGGGLLRVPIFIYLLPTFGVAHDVTMHVAAGTSLAVAVPTTAAGCWAQHKAGNLEWSFVRSWVPALLVGVLGGLAVQRYAPGRILILVFAIVLFLQSLQMLSGGTRLHFASSVPSGLPRWLIAALIGALSVAIGISGGAFVTPTLSGFGYPIHRALAIATATSLAVSSLGTVGSIVNGIPSTDLPKFSLGYVDLLAVVIMIPAVLVTAPLGVRVANRTSQKKLTRVFAIFMILIAADMTFDFFNRSPDRTTQLPPTTAPPTSAERASEPQTNAATSPPTTTRAVAQSHFASRSSRGRLDTSRTHSACPPTPPTVARTMRRVRTSSTMNPLTIIASPIGLPPCDAK